MLLEIYLIIAKCYTAPCYRHMIWNINLWKLPKWWFCHVWDLWLAKIEVTIQSFLLHLSRSVYFVTYLSTAHINCVIIFKFNQASSCAPFLLGLQCWVRWVEPSTKFSKRFDLTWPQSSDLRISESGCWER